jgi:hypothetical protein
MSAPSALSASVFVHQGIKHLPQKVIERKFQLANALDDIGGMLASLSPPRLITAIPDVPKWIMALCDVCRATSVPRGRHDDVVCAISQLLPLQTVTYHAVFTVYDHHLLELMATMMSTSSSSSSSSPPPNVVASLHPLFAPCAGALRIDQLLSNRRVEYFRKALANSWTGGDLVDLANCLHEFVSAIIVSVRCSMRLCEKYPPPSLPPSLPLPPTLTLPSSSRDDLVQLMEDCLVYRMVRDGSRDHHSLAIDLDRCFTNLNERTVVELEKMLVCGRGLAKTYS